MEGDRSPTEGCSERPSWFFAKPSYSWPVPAHAAEPGRAGSRCC